MITPSFGLTATERVLPRLALDFTTATLDSRISFTRSGNTATVINSSGNIAPINANLPRFDYTVGTGGACKGLLIEESRTNLVTNTVFAGAITGTPGTAPTGWTLASTGSPSLTVTPSLYGTLDGAQALTLAGVATERQRCFQTFSAVSGTTYVVSIYVESVTGTSGRLVAITGVTGTDVQTITNPSSPGRYSHIWTASATGTATVQFGLGTTAGIPGNCTIALSRIQLEAGAFATSYIPTTASQVTRSADVATMTGTNFSSWYNASEGTVNLTFQGLPNSSSQLARMGCINDGTANNSLISAWIAGVTTLRSRLVVGGATQFQFSGTIDPTAQNTSCAAYKVNDFAGAFNASTVSTDTSGTLWTPTQISFGADANGATNVFSGHLKKFNYWPQRLINAEVQSFSKG
jgi:hypothetical protein